MRMDKPKKCRNHNSLTNMFAISVTITLLTFGALTIDPLLVLATGEVEDEEENRNVDSRISNDNDLLSSSPLPSPLSQRSMNTDIIDSSPSGATIYLLNLLCRNKVRVTNGRNFIKCCLWTSRKRSSKSNCKSYLQWRWHHY